MRNEHKCAGILTQRFDQDVSGLNIEMVGGLIENQKVCGRNQRSGQCNAAAFPPGQYGDRLEHIVTVK